MKVIQWYSKKCKGLDYHLEEKLMKYVDEETATLISKEIDKLQEGD